MLQEKAGEVAGKIWNALNETEGLTQKQIRRIVEAMDAGLKSVPVGDAVTRNLLCSRSSAMLRAKHEPKHNIWWL